jgi:hypothetical protein
MARRRVAGGERLEPEHRLYARTSPSRTVNPASGWTQPILITADGLIIDGFHRVRLALDSRAILERYGGKLPCAVVDVSRPQGMIMTIRMNRAKGSHVAVRMSEIVRELIDVHGYEPIEVGIEIGATKEEIAILYQEGIFKMKNIDKYAYSKAWYPAETHAKSATR